MSNPGSGKKIASIEHQQHDDIEYRKRVATYIDGDTASYEDTDFVSANSPAVLDVFTDLDRIAHEGYVINDGPGDFTITFSTNGTDYGGIHTVSAGEILNFSNLKIKKIKLTHIDDSAYRVLVG